MATRAISWIGKSSLVNSLTQASFSSHSSSTVKQVQLSFPSAFRVSARDVTSPAIRSVISHPHCGSSIGATQLSQALHYSSTAGVYANLNIRFAKQRRNRGKMKGESDNRICFGKYGLQVLEPAWITSKQILAGQLAIKRTLSGRENRGKSLIRIFPHKPISLKPAETRMGRGKGSTAYWVAGVKAGRIIYELNGVPESNARRAILIAASKLPVRTRMVKY